MTEIIILHPELLLTNRLTDIRHDGLDLGPRMHAIAVVIPLVVMELHGAPVGAPRRDAEFFFLVAVIPLESLAFPMIACELAAGRLPAVFGFAFGARVAVFDGHGGRGGTAVPVEAVDGAEVVGVVFKVHVGGELGFGVGVEVGGGAHAGGLFEGVEV